MEIIVGTVNIKDDKILMIREAKEDCYSKWAFPAGHLEKNETIIDGAKRETLEETGFNVEITKVFPILVGNTEKRNIMMFHFLTNVLEEGEILDNEEILEKRWIPISDLKKMSEDKFRCYPVVKNIIDNLEKNNYYNLDILENMNI